MQNLVRLQVILAVMTLLSSSAFSADAESARGIARQFIKSDKFELSKVDLGWSGASVFKVRTGSKKYLLKIDATTAHEKWLQRLNVLMFVSERKLSPQLVYSDKTKQATISRYIDDQGFMSAYSDAAQSGHVLKQLVMKVKSLHELNYSQDLSEIDVLTFVRDLWKTFTREALPSFVQDIMTEFERLPVPEKHRLVFAHGDLNSSNILFDGNSVFLIDWDTATRVHPYYDLATIATYLHMDKKESEKLLTIYEGRELRPDEKAVLRYYRIGSYILNGSMFLLHAKGILPPTRFEDVASTRESFAKLAQGKLNLREAVGFQELSLSFFKEAKGLLSE